MGVIFVALGVRVGYQTVIILLLNIIVRILINKLVIIVVTKLGENHIFVFGSNPEGRHGMGAAKAAMQWGAKYGVGRGLQGQTYALVTKNLTKGFVEKCSEITYHKQGYQSVSYEMIQLNIVEMYECCLANPDKWFILPYKLDDKNLNGYSGKEMYEMFTSVEPLPRNVVFHISFKGVYHG